MAALPRVKPPTHFRDSQVSCRSGRCVEHAAGDAEKELREAAREPKAVHSLSTAPVSAALLPPALQPPIVEGRGGAHSAQQRPCATVPPTQRMAAASREALVLLCILTLLYTAAAARLLFCSLLPLAAFLVLNLSRQLCPRRDVAQLLPLPISVILSPWLRAGIVGVVIRFSLTTPFIPHCDVAVERESGLVEGAAVVEGRRARRGRERRRRRRSRCFSLCLLVSSSKRGSRCSQHQQQQQWQQQ
jgi:hypothetical protein